MPNQRISFMIAGAAGLGVKSSGLLVAKALSRVGKHVFGYTEYPSLIRGGHNTYQVIAEDEVVTAPYKMLTHLLALNKDAVENHKDEVDEKTYIVVDEGIEVEGVKGKIVQVPLSKTANELGNALMMNMVGLGVIGAEMGIEMAVMEELVKENFADKKKEIMDKNVEALQKGYAMAGQGFKASLMAAENRRMVLGGSESVGMGAIAAGVHMYSAYPMTPSTPVLHYLTKYQYEYDFVVRQVEDEISAINMALGASFTGAKSMTGTSGGGFALMNEGISLAGILELPLVIYMAMRPGPATGLPTWTSQGDLRFVIHSGHGEFPKIVLTPGDVVEAYELTHKAFELSQKYQTVVVVLVDKFLSESVWTLDGLEQKDPVPLMKIEPNPEQPEGSMFHRYKAATDGVSLRTIPGIHNGQHIANSDEHNAEGLADESAEMRNAMSSKRMLKLETARQDMDMPKMYGKEGARMTLVGWGSVKGSVLEAMKANDSFNFIHFTHVWPLPDGVKELLSEKKLVFIENNTTGQFEGLIREHTGIEAFGHLRKDDGRPFYPDEINELLKKL